MRRQYKVQEGNRPRIKWQKGKISKLINSKDDLVRGFELLVNKGILNQTVGRTVQHLIPLEKSRHSKNEVSIELNESQEEHAKELDYRNDTGRKTIKMGECQKIFVI